MGDSIRYNRWYWLPHTTNVREAYSFFVLLATICVIALAYYAYNRGFINPQLDGYGVIGLSALPLLILFIQFSGIKNQAAQQGVYLEYQFGLWGTVLGYLSVIVGGVFNLRE